MFHRTFMEIPESKTWCHNLALSNEEKTVLSRIRSGHTLTKDRRHQWGWEYDELCDYCEEKEDINHILFICPKYNIERVEFPILEYNKPLSAILKENSEADLKQIVQFVKQIKIRL